MEVPLVETCRDITRPLQPSRSGRVSWSETVFVCGWKQVEVR